MSEIDKSLLLIANNNARRRSIRKAHRLAAAAERKGFSVNLQFTKSAEEAQGILSGDLSEVGVIGVVGGDGTVGSVVSALLNKESDNNPTAAQAEPKTPVLAVFGGGSTDVLRKKIGMPRFGATRTIRAIEEGLVYKADVIKVTIDGGQQSIAVSNLSLGASAALFKGERFLGRGGTVGYGPKLLCVIRDAQHLQADMNVGDETGAVNRTLERSTDLFIHNGGNLGKLRINPDKKYDSGQIETIRPYGRSKSSRVNALKTLGVTLCDSLRGRQSRSEERILGKKVKVSLFQNAHLQIDGDYQGEVTSLVCEVIPAAVGIVVPEQKRKRRGFGKQGEAIKWNANS